MAGILYMGFTALGGWIGWAAASPLGMTAGVIGSLIGTAVGVYASGRINRYFRG